MAVSKTVAPVRLCFFWNRTAAAVKGLPLMDAAQGDEKVTCAQAAHNNANQGLKRYEHLPRLRQHHIAVTKARVSDAGKIEGRFGLGQAATPQIEPSPDRNFRQMEQEKPPD